MEAAVEEGVPPSVQRRGFALDATAQAHTYGVSTHQPSRTGVSAHPGVVASVVCLPADEELHPPFAVVPQRDELIDIERAGRAGAIGS